MRQKLSGHKVAAAILSAAGLLAVSLAQAGDATAVRKGDLDTRTVAVRYGDLDLSREEGVKALYLRLQLAAKRVCGSYDLRNLGERRAWQDCYDTALAGAVAQAGNERLAALHQSADKNRQRVLPRIAAGRPR